jgi:hypothetical protein
MRFRSQGGIHVKSPLAGCRTRLIQQLAAQAPHLTLDSNGYTMAAADNLIAGVALADFEADLRQGDGNEMEGKFRAAHSSSALAVNNFGPFKTLPTRLRLCGRSGFSGLQFERKCPHGLAGRKPPNLDVLAEGADGIVAVESKCLEYLSAHAAQFAPAYEREIQDARRSTAWFAEMSRLMADPRRYRQLDAAQLIKHAFGLLHTFPERDVTLLYLFWEPENPESHTVFADHRAEIQRFSQAVAPSGPRFRALSYPELWAKWDYNSSTWMTDHVSRLRARYGVAL